MKLPLETPLWPFSRRSKAFKRNPENPLFAWLGIVLALAILHVALLHQTAVVRMLVLVTGLFLLAKVFVYGCWKKETGRDLPRGRFALFLFPWPGMRPEIFQSRAKKSKAIPAQAWRHRFLALLAGSILLIGAHAMLGMGLPAWTASPFVLAGLSLTVHFGLLGLLGLAYRRLGYSATPAFLNPLTSPNLTTFWTKRWNRPFTELLVWTVTRPVQGRLGRAPAVWFGFLASGLLHEVAISLPVQAGFGLPTLYFLFQGAGVATEHRWLPTFPAWARPAILGLFILLPLPLVFHPPFVMQVLFPLAGLSAP